MQSHILKKTIFVWVWCETDNGRSVIDLQRPSLVFSLFTLTWSDKSTCATIAVPIEGPTDPSFPRVAMIEHVDSLPEIKI